MVKPVANTDTIHNKAASSSVVAKAWMAITGLLLIAFLLMHMFGNTKLFLGTKDFNDYSESLREFLHPILPHMFFLWLFRIVLVLAILVHIFCAFKVWKQANGGNYQRKSGIKRYTPFVMRYSGITIFLFVIFHILQFTAEVVHVGYEATPRNEKGHIIDSADRMIYAFSAQHWWVLAVYAIMMILICLHVYHGVWSALATLGANVSNKAKTVLHICAGMISVLLYIGFMAAPVAIMMGVIHK